jgi:hypothetical protein
MTADETLAEIIEIDYNSYGSHVIDAITSLLNRLRYLVLLAFEPAQELLKAPLLIYVPMKYVQWEFFVLVP